MSLKAYQMSEHYTVFYNSVLWGRILQFLKVITGSHFIIRGEDQRVNSTNMAFIYKIIHIWLAIPDDIALYYSKDSLVKK